MELETRHLVAGSLIALAIGGGYAWWSAQPHPDRSDEARAATSESVPAPIEYSATPGKAPTLYKWKDDAGVWNYTDKPPADREYTAISGTPNVNSVPTVVPESPIDNAPAEVQPQE